MIHEAEMKLLRTLLRMTVDKTLVWERRCDGWFIADIKVDDEYHVISFRFLYYRVTTHQNCVTPGMAEILMYGGPRKFAVGTEGFALCQEIYDRATWSDRDGLDFLDAFLEGNKDS